MKRSLLYFFGILMTITGLVIGCAHDRCGNGSCGQQSGSFSPAPGVGAGQYGSGNAGPIPQSGQVYGGGQPAYSAPRTDSFGGSGSR